MYIEIVLHTKHININNILIFIRFVYYVFCSFKYSNSKPPIPIPPLLFLGMKIKQEKTHAQSDEKEDLLPRSKKKVRATQGSSKEHQEDQEMKTNEATDQRSLSKKYIGNKGVAKDNMKDKEEEDCPIIRLPRKEKAW